MKRIITIEAVPYNIRMNEAMTWRFLVFKAELLNLSV